MWICEWMCEWTNEETKKRMSEWMFHSIAIKRDCPTPLECYLMTQYMSQSMEHTSYATFFGGVPRNIATSFFHSRVRIPRNRYKRRVSHNTCHRRGLWRGGPNPISQEIVFFKYQLKSHNPSLRCSNWNPLSHFSIVFVSWILVPVHKIPFPSLQKRQIPAPILPLHDPLITNIL